MANNFEGGNKKAVLTKVALLILDTLIVVDAS